MQNFATKWKKDIKLRQIPYHDFVTIPDDHGIYIPKVDGMLAPLIYGKGKTFFQTTTAKQIVDIPAINEYVSLFEKLGITEAKIAGELVAQRGGTILPFNVSQSVVKTSRIPANKDLIYHYPFDIISLNHKNYNFTNALRFFDKNIGKIGLPHIRWIGYESGGLKVFRKLYEKILETQGFDGVVVRNYNGRNYKVKFVESADLVVIGAGHENMKAWQKGEVSYLLTAFIDKNGLFRSSSKIGTGFKRTQRTNFFNFVKDNYLYKEDGEYFLKPQLVVETKYFRYRITNTPTYKFQNGIYKQVGNNRSITFSNPSYERLRKDKKATKYDTRLEQIPEWKY